MGSSEALSLIGPAFLKRGIADGSFIRSGEVRDREGEAADPYPGRDGRLRTARPQTILVMARTIQSMPCTDCIVRGSRQAGRDQQAAYQPSGNGTSGQGAPPLSLAARGDG
jgi:hypothetical protein